ncbi:MAG TPA: VWA domain-containing protein [Gemmataceae bacterium]
MNVSAPAPDAELRKQRQVLFWRLLAAGFGMQSEAKNIDATTAEVADTLGLPRAILDDRMAIDTLLQRYPELQADFDSLQAVFQPPADGEVNGQPAAPTAAADEDGTLRPEDLRRSLAFSKLLLNVFGPNTMTATVTAQQFQQWRQEVGRLGECMGCGPDGLAGAGGMRPGDSPGGESGAGVSGQFAGRTIGDEQLQQCISELEGDLIKRMALREVLKDDRMAAQLPVSMSVVEQLLLDKANLSGNALKNAKMLIRKYVDQLAEAMKKQVVKAARGKIDRSVPPKRVFRNLDLKRTIWKNLIHYNPGDGRLYVDQLFYRHTASKELPKRLIVVVDQSGSMVDAMVQSAILASIFASLPKVDVHMFAFDTNVIDLTPWVHEPFEMLMRTNLGGGNDGPKAMREAQSRIAEPRNTTMVWISDFYEFQNDQPLFEMIKQVKESGVRFIPVGALKSGYFSVNEWFRDKLKQIGLPVLSGTVQKLINELRHLL